MHALPHPPTGDIPVLRIQEAHPAWSLILQSGARIACTVGIPLAKLLRSGLGLCTEQLRPVDALLLDGMPVDEPETTIVPDGARVALAAGLPGIAGLAMKSGSAVKALRSGITHTRGGTPDPRPGAILLSLYSLVLPLLAGHFLQRGILVEAAQVLRYARFAPDDRCLLGKKALLARDLPQELPQAHPDAPVVLSVGILCHI